MNAGQARLTHIREPACQGTSSPTRSATTTRGSRHESGPSLARVRRAGGLVLHDGRGPRDRQRRAADHRPQAAHARIEPAVGRHRLRAHLRRLPAARRPRRGPAGPPPHPDGRPGPVHRGVAGLRAGDARLGPDPDALPARARRGDRAPGGAVDRDEHVPRGRRAEQGTGRVGRHRGQRRDRRGDRRRPAHPLRRLAVHLLPQRPDRSRGAAARPAHRAGEPARHRTPALRPVRRGHRDRRPVAARLRGLDRPAGRLGHRQDGDRCSRCPPPCSPPSWSSRRASRRR